MLHMKTQRGDGEGLTQRTNVVMVRPNQSLMLNVKKQQTAMKKRSEGRETGERQSTAETRRPADTAEGQRIPQLWNMVFTSAVTAGNTESVTVNTKVTQEAITQI